VTRSIALSVLAAVMAACGGGEPGAPEPGLEPPTSAAPMPDETIMAHWSRNCALCHVDGTGGAPRLGVEADWAPRRLAGEEVLLAHTVEGFNNMPPLGYCMSCTEADFRALVRFMSASGVTP
jgi:cytochrome c5